jgi:hypothetical protein
VNGESYIERRAVRVGPARFGRAELRVDVVIDGELVESWVEGSPAPLAVVQEHERRSPLGRDVTRHPWESAGSIRGTGELVVRCRLCGAPVVESDSIARREHELWHESRREP